MQYKEEIDYTKVMIAAVYQMIIAARLVSSKTSVAKDISSFEVYSCAGAVLGARDLQRAFTGRALSRVEARLTLLEIERKSFGSESGSRTHWC